MNLDAIKPNPDNPRKISKAQMKKLCESIKRDPEFMKLRPIVIDAEGMILGGNQRYAACRQLGMSDVPDEWVVRAADLTPEQARRFIIVDNAPDGMAGEWDLEILSSDAWQEMDFGEDLKLEELGIHMNKKAPMDSLIEEDINIQDGIKNPFWVVIRASMDDAGIIKNTLSTLDHDPKIKIEFSDAEFSDV